MVDMLSLVALIVLETVVGAACVWYLLRTNDHSRSDGQGVKK